MAYNKTLGESLKKIIYSVNYIILSNLNIKLLNNYRKTNNIIEFKFSDIHNIEAPVFLFNYLVNSIASELKKRNFNEINIIHQITVQNRIMNFKTPLQLFKMICLSNYNNFYTAIFDDKTYYFSKGVLFDKNFDVLFCINSNGNINTDYTNINEINFYLYINSSIFNKTDKISNYIKNTLIPTFNGIMNKEKEKIVIKKLDFIKQYYQYIIEQ